MGGMTKIGKIAIWLAQPVKKISTSVYLGTVVNC